MIQSVRDFPYPGQMISFLNATLDMRFAASTVLVDAIYAELVASAQIRFGPAPEPSAAAYIKGIIERTVAAQSPLRVLVPWGSRKPSTAHSVDIAEWMALHQLSSLQQRISAVYAPGIQINIRVEDASGMWLFRNDSTFDRSVSKRYVEDFSLLFEAFRIENAQTILESDYVTEEAFARESEYLVPFFLNYLLESDKTDVWEGLSSRTALEAEGWKGAIPVEQRDFYRTQYAKFFPELDYEGRTMKLAEYLANALARHRLGITGTGPGWGSDFVQLNFAPPAPGTPSTVGHNRIYYRTIPAKYCTTHLPPWRARGYMKFDGVSLVPKVCTDWTLTGSTCVQASTPKMTFNFQVLEV